MKRKLIIDKKRKTVTFKDNEKELTIPVLDFEVCSDLDSYQPVFNVTINFVADTVECK